MRWLRIFVESGSRSDKDSTAALRRQLLLVDEFRRLEWTVGTTFDPPEILRRGGFEQEHQAWLDAPRPFGGTTLAELIDCETAVLEVSGDFSHDPRVTYALACYRATRWWADTAVLLEEP